MLINHCNIDFMATSVWFLADLTSLDALKCFENRKLLFAQCPHCQRQIVSLIETRPFDNKLFINTVFGKKADKIIQQEKPKILYTELQCSCAFNKKSGWRYGINTAIKNKKNKITQIRQYSSDFFGQRDLVKKIKTNLSICNTT